MLISRVQLDRIVSIVMTDSTSLTAWIYLIVNPCSHVDLCSFQSVADDEVFLPNDEIWVYDLEQGVW